MKTFLILGVMSHLNEENRVIVHAVHKVEFCTPTQLALPSYVEDFLKDYDSYLIPSEYKGTIEWDSNYYIDSEGLLREKELSDDEEV